jgi:hypothetical protein
MFDQPYYICSLSESLTTARRADIIDRCLELGLVPKGAQDIDLEEAEDVPRQTAQHSEMVDFSYDSLTDISITFNINESWQWNEPRLLASLSIIKGLVEPDDIETVTEHRINDFVDIVAELMLIVKPEYAWGMFIPSEYEDQFRPADRPIQEHVDQFSWITIIGPSLIDGFGGRDYILEAPAARVDELETGHIMLVKTERFFDHDTRETALEEYLL